MNTPIDLEGATVSEENIGDRRYLSISVPGHLRGSYTIRENETITQAMERIAASREGEAAILRQLLVGKPWEQTVGSTETSST